MNKRNFAIISIVILVISFFVVIRWIQNNDKKLSMNNTTTQSPTTKLSETDELFATPEHMKNPENHNLTLEIISPESDKIFPAQARMYQAHIRGNAKYEMAKILCHWKFYLNENNEEVLFREMENSSILGEGEKDVCGFTNTFIDRIGRLRVELTAELTTISGDSLEEVKAEKLYVVTK